MTITEETIETKFVNAYEADKPCFVVKNLLTGGGFSGVSNKWFREDRSPTSPPTTHVDPTFVSDGTATQADLSTLPIRYTYDNRAALYSSPDDGVGGMDNFFALYGSRWYTLAGSSYAEHKQDFYADAVVIKANAMGKTDLGMSGGLPAGTLGVQLFMSEASNFSASRNNDPSNLSPYGLMNATVYADESGSNPHPSRTGESRTIAQVIPDEATNHRYKINGDAFFRLRLFCKGGTDHFTTVPRIGEVFVGERIQMSRNPNQPYATELSYMNNSIDFESGRGDIVRYVRSKGRRRFELEFTPTGDDSYGIDDLEQIKLLVKKTNQFTEPFVYIPKPYTEPNNAYFVYAEDASFDMEAVGPFERSVRLSLVEIPPFVGYELGI